MLESVSLVERIDDHSEVLHVRLCNPIPTMNIEGRSTGGKGRLQRLLGIGTAPRDLCLLRYWRIEDDGCYVIYLNSYDHDACSEKGSASVRGTLHGFIKIAPRRDYMKFEEDLNECRITMVTPLSFLLTSCTALFRLGV